MAQDSVSVCGHYDLFLSLSLSVSLSVSLSLSGFHFVFLVLFPVSYDTVKMCDYASYSSALRGPSLLVLACR